MGWDRRLNVTTIITMRDSQIDKRHWAFIGWGMLLAIPVYLILTNWPFAIPDNSQIIIRLQRTGCEGTCPGYQLTLYDNGTVVYYGEDYVRTHGIRKANIGADKVQALAARLEAAGYFSLNDNYDHVTASDFPSAITYVKIGAREKGISHHYGDSSAPSKLYEFEKAIDDAVNSGQWVRGCGLAYPLYCMYNPFFWILTLSPLALAGWIIWHLILERKTIAGIILAQAAVFLIWAIVAWILISDRSWGNQFPDIFGFYSLLGIAEFIGVVPLAILLVRYSQRSTNKPKVVIV